MPGDGATGDALALALGGIGEDEVALALGWATWRGDALTLALREIGGNGVALALGWAMRWEGGEMP